MHLGADRSVGGGDDRQVDVVPSYVDGGTQIGLSFQAYDTLDLGAFYRDGNLPAGGGLGTLLGNWQMSTDGASVLHVATESGYPSYFLGDSSPADAPQYARLKVESDSSDDSIGLVINLKHRFYGQNDYGPDTYYALTWKRTTEDKVFGSGDKAFTATAEEGIRLLRLKDLAGRDASTLQWLLWDGDYSWNGRVTVLDSSLGDDRGWEPNVEYIVSWRTQTNGAIDLAIARASDGQPIWETHVVDPSPLPAGADGF